MGSRRKQVRFQAEAKHTDRRRSGRIIALEEKKQKEIETKIALALERKNNSTNNDKSNKEKGKATMVHYKRHPMQPRTSRHAMVPLKHDGGNSGTHSTVPETEKRDMYWPPSNKSQFSEFLNVNKPNIQLNINPSNYKDSLLRFVEGLGPTAQRVAAHKLKSLQLQQTLNDESPTQNLLANVGGIHQPNPQPPTQPYAPNNAKMLSNAFPLFNRPLTIPGNVAQGNKNVNTNSGGSVSIRDCANEGNKFHTNENWNAPAAVHLDNFLLNNEIGGSCSEFESSNVRGTMDKMVLPPSSSNVLTHVYPTRVIPKPLEAISNNSPIVESSIQHERPEETMPSNNHSELPIFPPQVAYFPFEIENPLFGLGFSYAKRDFQGSKYFNNSPFSVQENHEKVLHQPAPYTPQVSYGFPEGQMQLIDPLNHLGPFPPETPLGSKMNYYGGGAAPLKQTQEDIPQLLWDNDQQHNLTLQLKHGSALP